MHRLFRAAVIFVYLIGTVAYAQTSAPKPQEPTQRQSASESTPQKNDTGKQPGTFVRLRLFDNVPAGASAPMQAEASGGIQTDPSQTILSSGQSLTYGHNVTTLVPSQNIKSPYYTNQTQGNLINYMQDTPPINKGRGASHATFYNVLFTGKGINNGNGLNGNVGWSVTKGQQVVFNDYTSGIGQVLSIAYNRGSKGDGAALYAYCFSQGGAVDRSGEGMTCGRFNGGILAGNTYAGTVMSTTTGTGLTHLATTATAGFPLANGLLIDETNGPVWTGNAIAQDNKEMTITTAGELTPATGIGETSDEWTLPEPSTEGITHTANVHLTSGRLTSGIVTFACKGYLDVYQADVTADGGSYKVTAPFLHGYESGCAVYQGGHWGAMDFIADRQATHYKTSYFVVAIGKHTLKYNYYVLGGRGAIQPWKHSFGASAMAGSITRTANVAKACDLGAATAYFSGQYVRVTSPKDTTLNYEGPASNLDPSSCFTYPSTGRDTTASITGATVQAGGDVGGQKGTGAIALWKVAEVKKVGAASWTDENGRLQQGIDGSFELGPNDIAFHAGDNVAILQDMAAKNVALSGIMGFDTMPNASTNQTMLLQFGGQGVTGAFEGARIANATPFANYKNGGGSGQLEAPIGLRLAGPYGATLLMQAPMLNGTAINILGNDPMTAGYPSSYNVLSALGYQERRLLWSYDPREGVTTLINRTRAGSISLQMTNDSIISTSGAGGFKFNGTGPFRIQAMSGAGQGCAYFDSTGALKSTGAPCGGGRPAASPAPAEKQAPVRGVTVSGSSCTITAITNGIITAATCK